VWLESSTFSPCIPLARQQQPRLRNEQTMDSPTAKHTGSAFPLGERPQARGSNPVPEPRDLVTSRPRLLVRRLVVVDKWYADCPLDEDGRG